MPDETRKSRLHIDTRTPQCTCNACQQQDSRVGGRKPLRSGRGSWEAVVHLQFDPNETRPSCVAPIAQCWGSGPKVRCSEVLRSRCRAPLMHNCISHGTCDHLCNSAVLLSIMQIYLCPSRNVMQCSGSSMLGSLEPLRCGANARRHNLAMFLNPSNLANFEPLLSLKCVRHLLTPGSDPLPKALQPQHLQHRILSRPVDLAIQVRRNPQRAQ